MGWLIFFAIVVLILLLLLLLSSLKVEFAYDGDIRLRVSFLFFTIFKYPADKKTKRKKRGKPEKTDKTDTPPEQSEGAAAESSEESGESAPQSGKSENKSEKKGAAKKKLSLAEIIEVAKLVLDSLGKPLKKLLKRSQIHHMLINITCGGEDAAAAALNFGKMNILVGNALGWLASIFTLEPADDIHIGVDFYSEDTKAEVSFVLKASVLTALAFLLTLVGRAVRYYLKNPGAQKAVGKLI
ncbi:MAG: hypothetical protein ACI4Q4_09340 [Oscillospiraceae bacterium]